MLELTTSILFPSKMLKRDSSFINKLQRFTKVRDELGYERETFSYIVIQGDERKRLLTVFGGHPDHVNWLQTQISSGCEPDS